MDQIESEDGCNEVEVIGKAASKMDADAGAIALVMRRPRR
jgi:hypothetical protein